ncbi:hypothetical protein T09_4191 [Trichinella sp. T9]|nr:hypothetical protein T09_4191 [Trichinella sp. T9]
MRVRQISQFYEFHTAEGSWLRWLRVRHDRSASLIPNHLLLLGLQASRSTSSTLEPAVPIRVCDFDRRWIVHSDPPSVVRTLRTAYMWSKSNVRDVPWLKVITICDPVLDVL